MALDALIFDLDGTLVDSNLLHLRAWQEAFAKQGCAVGLDRLADEIGKSAREVVAGVLGWSVDGTLSNTLCDEKNKQFRLMAGNEGVQLCRGTVELLHAARGRGLRVALVSTGTTEHVKAMSLLTGTEFFELCDVVITADDAEAATGDGGSDGTSPEIGQRVLCAAVRRLDLSAAQCAAVVDTPYDVQTARHAGLACAGVSCGRLFGADQLHHAGARAVWSDPADLLRNLDEALTVVSPGLARLTNDLMHTLMRAALETARQGIDAGEVPIGCVLARGDGSIIARGFNRMNATQNKTAHAEVVAFQDAAGKCPLDCRDLILVSTLEPCVMCTGAAMEASVDTILYALPAPADNGTSRVAPPTSPEAQLPRFIGRILADDSRALFQTWLDANGDTPQASFVTQLLKLNE